MIDRRLHQQRSRLGQDSHPICALLRNCSFNYIRLSNVNLYKANLSSER
ncbi:MAG: hypothetical protein HC852_22470 [Acaryochloridaceae cyanobacterium RU_4_10]|nr:hypothetical protein [Acaryochloridaceae cyanobacterium RU_4_10]